MKQQKTKSGKMKLNLICCPTVKFLLQLKTSKSINQHTRSINEMSETFSVLSSDSLQNKSCNKYSFSIPEVKTEYLWIFIDDASACTPKPLRLASFEDMAMEYILR